ncbi:MAG: FAD binding domain-containing protein [Acidimicrobiaceae bacterium]|nr:FAD binding domain-containing protein [Acidimicrobiaceae bacterium]
MKEFVSAQSIDEALDTLSRFGDDCLIMAGGTDIMIQQRTGDIDPRRYLHIERIESLKGILVDEKILIGSTTSHHSIVSSKNLQRLCPGLVSASATVGGWQTQEAGTLGGNICNASPAADTIPSLLAANALVHLKSSSAERTVRLDEFIVGRRMTSRLEGELLVAIEVEALPANASEVYIKVGPRSAMEVALVGLAVRISISPLGIVENVAIATCSVGPKPFRAIAAETAILGSQLEDEAVMNAVSELTQEASPMDDFRASARYRKQVLGSALVNALNICQLQHKLREQS